jgi:cholest-4-en-3-one 26-monooxygenase
VNLFRRTAIRDTELARQKIAGDKVVMFYSSANRDEDAFTAPREFDICRDPNPHVWVRRRWPELLPGPAPGRP